MDLVKGFTDFQRRNAKQQKQPADYGYHSQAAKQPSQAVVCRFCTWGTPNLTAASYLQHLKDAHADAVAKTELNDKSNHVTLREIDDALDAIAEET
jgi:hypothetical protein